MKFKDSITFPVIVRVFLIAFLISVTTSAQVAQAQSNYSKGFAKGFDEGFCYGIGIGCLPPLAPITPILRIGESLENYKQGYNRGFQVGLDMNRMEGRMATSVPKGPSVSRYAPIHVPSEYFAPVDLQLLSDLIQIKQKLYDSRVQWIGNRISAIGDFAIVLLGSISPSTYQKFSGRFNSFIKTQLNSQRLDYSEESVFAKVVLMMNSYEREAYSSYVLELSKVPVLRVPTGFPRLSTHGKCSFRAKNSEITSYSAVAENGLLVGSEKIRTFEIEFPESPISESVKGYYLFSEADNNYYTTIDDDVAKASKTSKDFAMQFLFSAESFFMFANDRGGFWLFDRGVSRTESLTDLGFKPYKLTSGVLSWYKVFQDNQSKKTYYIEKGVFDNGTIFKEYPIFSK